MNYTEYLKIFEQMLHSENPPTPYDKEEYLNYTKLNLSRSKRWSKTLRIDQSFIEALTNKSIKQHWIIITEPWCGDSAHILPFIISAIKDRDNITYDIQLRDTAPFLIESYLTNGGKSIPKVIVKDDNGKDLFTWGPRPLKAQKVMNDLKAQGVNSKDINEAMQNWYNADKGKTLYTELTELLNSSLLF
ncbi:thioredoxin family protein [Myroides odoratimimus]|uniref:thioredoxin family protein n=1 Tax=Myroides odoratimimus TaxID=76832 RepID=UPI003100C446